MSDTLGLVGVILFFAASAWSVWAVVGLIRPAWMPPLSPKRRLPGFGVAVLIAGALGIAANLLGDPSTTPPTANAQADTAYTEPRASPVTATAQAALSTFTDPWTLAENIEAIAAYCTLIDIANSAQETYYAELDAGGDEEVAQAKLRSTEQELFNQFNTQFNLADTPESNAIMLQVSVDAGWDSHCAAADIGWTAFNEFDAQVDRSVANTVRERFLGAFFGEYQNGSTSSLINSWPDGGAIDCKRKAKDGIRFVGCQVVILNEGVTPWYVFMLGRDWQNDGTLVYPVTGSSRQLWEQAIGPIVTNSPDFDYGYFTPTNTASALNTTEVLALFE